MSASAWERVLGGAFSWDAEKEAALTQLWADGLSTAQIGVRLGCNKNQVIGKAHRLGLPARKMHPALERASRQRALRPKRVPEPPPKPVARAPMRHEAIEPLRTPRIPPSARLPVPVGVHPPHRRCQFAVNDAKPWRFCDAPSVDGYSWCHEHKAVVFRPMSEARDAA